MSSPRYFTAGVRPARRALLRCSASARDQLVPRESLGRAGRTSTANPWPLPSRRSAPPQAVAGHRVDVWVALPDHPQRFPVNPSCCFPWPGDCRRSLRASTALGSSRSTVVLVLVADEQMPKLLGAQANKAKISVVWNPGRWGNTVSIPVVTVGHRPRGPGRQDWNASMAPSPWFGGTAELAELLAACQSGLARAAVVAERSEELTAYPRGPAGGCGGC